MCVCVGLPLPFWLHTQEEDGMDIKWSHPVSKIRGKKTNFPEGHILSVWHKDN